MLVLFETAAGYAVFKLLKDNTLEEIDNLYKDFESPEKASKIVKLKFFEKFVDTTDALSAATATVEGKVSKPLKKILKKLVAKDVQDQLLVADANLGKAIKEKMSLSCMSSTAVLELMRCIRSQADSLIGSLPSSEMAAMSLGLAHSLGRYKLKFSPDKVDTMIVQAVSLLDDLDKELNNYIMRCKEWYSWHFPEVTKLIQDNVTFIKVIKLMGMRHNAKTTDFSEILPEDLEEKLKEAAEISMGTEISDEDIENISFLADQVLEISEYRTQLYEYLKNRMMAIAPNLTVLVGELVGARLIAHAGTLINLAKHPASTVQILGAEKALFRALKTKKDTPKYGLIYHAQLVGQASTKLKGKASRMLAAKAALAARVDALGEETSLALGTEHRAYLEARIRQLETGDKRAVSAMKKKFTPQKYDNKSEVRQYLRSQDSSVTKKRQHDEEEGNGETVEETQEVPKKKKKKDKKVKVEPEEEVEDPPAPVEEAEEPPKKKKKKSKKSKTEEDE
ncbi:nucleolar protein 58 [Folsomia candida]|uniref:Nucleolar protein 58 n=2 Tax=Collembola TaxID=30001 RepID=A0A226EHV1_FOLCA|nr:nucleolar protein 58 [Folsomia candida]OXA56920.1 Nucleolar protein 58 [Folsomia candida]